MTVAEQREDMLSYETSAAGYIVFVAMDPLDRLVDLFSQMYHRADAAAAIVPIPEAGVWSSQFATRDEAPSEWGTLSDWGPSEGSTFSEVMNRLGSMPQRRRALVVA